MKIALLAPLTRPVHSDTRGSRPKIVYDLAMGLKAKGHDVTIYGPGDCEIPVKIVKVIEKSVYNLPPAENPFYQHTIALAELVEKIRQDSDKYDIIHNHVYPEYLPLLVSHCIKSPVVTTPHLYLWPEYTEILKKFSNTFFVAISDYQRKVGEGVNFVDRIYNGISTEDFEYNQKPKDYFLFFGRIKKFKDQNGGEIDPKGVLDAIKVCKKANVKLYIAGNVENKDFYEEEIKPHLNDKIKFIGPVDSVGPIGFKEKNELYKNALGYFFLSHWDEGCPLGPMEAMACGTPVIANRRSSLPEIVEDNITGFIVNENDIDGAVDAVENIQKIDRKKCRERAENNFSNKIMVDNYEKVYQKILGGK